MTTRTLALVLALGAPLLLTGCWRGKPRATIEAFGRFSVTGQLRAEKAGDGSGDVKVLGKEEMRLLERTDRIPCAVGETWGLILRGANVPADRECCTLCEITHPPFKMPDGSVVTTTVSERKQPPGGSPDGFYGWHFLKGYEYELVAGEWTVVVFINYAEVARKTFAIGNVSREAVAERSATPGAR